MRKLLFTVFLLAVTLQASFAVPLTMTYQGKLTTDAGLPVADGSHSLSFGFFGNATGGSPLWSHGPVSVTTTGGVFSVNLPINSAHIQADSTIWLQTTADGSVLLPRIQLLAAPYAVRASNADSANTVPDGSITPEKLSPQIVIPRPSFQNPVQSGLPAGSLLEFSIDSKPLIAAWLGAPFEINYDVIEHRIIGEDGSTIVRKIPGEIDWTTLVIRRYLSKDRSWIEWAEAAFSGLVLKNIDFRLVDPDGRDLCKWDGGNAWLQKYNLKLVDDGYPIEEISVIYRDEQSLPTITTPKFFNFSPSGVPVQTGITTLFASPDIYKLKPTGKETLIYNPIASDISLQFGVVTQAGTSGNRKIPGPATLPDVKLLRTPAGSKYLLDFWLDIQDRQFDRQQFDILIGKDQTPYARIIEAWPSAYKLIPTNDGLLFEEFTIVHEGLGG